MARVREGGAETSENEEEPCDAGGGREEEETGVERSGVGRM